MVTYIFFDIDDTLLFTSKNAYKKHCWICDKLGLPHTNKQLYFSYYGEKTIEEMASILIPRITVKEYLDLYLESSQYIKYSPIYPNIKNIFSLLNWKWYKIWILTNWSSEKTNKKISVLWIKDYCSYIFHGENLKYKKPNSNVFDQVFYTIKEDKFKIIYIWDSLEDYFSTIWKWVTFYAVLTWYTQKEKFINAWLNDKFIYKNINCLLPLL